MNDFRNKQQPSHRSKSIDGFPRSARRFDQPSGSIGFGDKPKQPSASASAPRSTQMDNFRRADGFHPAQRQQFSSVQNKRPYQDPIVVENKKPKRRSLKDRLLRRNSGLDGMGRRKTPLSRKKKILRGLAIFIAIIVLLVGFLFAKGYLNLRKVLTGGGGAAALQENVDPSKLKGEGDGRINVLLLGRGGEGHEGADLTDTIILVSIDPIAKEAALLSVPRDLYVKVPGSGSMKINSAFYTGKTAALKRYSRPSDDNRKQAEEAGFTLLENTIENTLGIPVHYHAMVDFSGFQQAINTVGGIDINAPNAVTENMRIDGKNYKLDVKSGQQHMDGFKALAYSRSRHTSARGDFDRSERQRAIIIALKEKVLSLGTFGNPQKISQLIGNFGDHVQTNFSAQDLKRLYDLTKDINGNKVQSIALVDPPHDYLTTSNIGGQSVVVPKAGTNDYAQIQSYLRNVLKDSYLKDENASVMILNGTTVAGVATQKGEELKSFGYNLIGVSNAPTKDYTKSVIVDLRGGTKKYTRNYLEKRFGVSAVSTIPDPAIQPGNADFVIIIGVDQAKL
jgi:LCP family protein required for cell wall assembly